MPDIGHDALVHDLEELLADAKRFEFHDFKNSTFAAPKVALAQRFNYLREQVVRGRYDNEPERV